MGALQELKSALHAISAHSVIAASVQLDLGKALSSLGAAELAVALTLQQQLTCSNSTSERAVYVKGQQKARFTQTAHGFSMFVYPDHDFVSQSLADTSVGQWEQEEVDNIQVALAAVSKHLGPTQQPLFVDVGANIGWFTLSAASLGARVFAFEGLPDNIALLKGSLCTNPDLAANITLFPFGLSSANDTCFVIARDGNLGDGFTKCGVKSAQAALAAFPKGYVLRGRMPVRRMDALVQETIHVMKMDVEGWEYSVLQGATQLLLHQQVWFLTAEANRGIVGEDGAYFLLEFLKANGFAVSNVGFKGPFISMRDIEKRSVKWQGVNLFAVRRKGVPRL